MISKDKKTYKIGVIGTGFIAKGLISLLKKNEDYNLIAVLTRTSVKEREDLTDKNLFTNNIEDLLKADLIVEATGDAIYAADNIDIILKHKIPVVTMNSEFHVTVGSYFINKGLLTEAEGDQPGSLAILREDMIAMGFKPLAYANIKGFLNLNPTEKDMRYWSEKSGYGLDMTTSFTDGTKVQIEQVLVANGFNIGIAQEGMLGLEYDDINEGGYALAKHAKELGYPISDYLLSPKLNPGVCIAAEHELKDGLKTYKMGDGPYYVIERPFHLCFFEIIKTINRVFNGGGVLLNNGINPRFSVASIAKRDMKAGTEISKGIGSFDVRGIAIAIEDHLTHVPIGLMKNAKLIRDVKEGDFITFSDVELEESLAVRIWKKMHFKKTV